MNFTQLKIEGFRIIEELANNDQIAKPDKLTHLQTEVRALIGDAVEELIQTLPLGFKQAVDVVFHAGGMDFVLNFLVPMVSEELYQVWKLLHGDQAPAVPKAN